MAYLGLDIGTTGCKAVIFSEDGVALASAYREYDLLTSEDGTAELDSAEVLRHCDTAIREVAGSAGKDVKTLAISTQGEAVTAVAAGGKFLCNAMVSSDSRPAAVMNELHELIAPDQLYEITGHTPHSLFTLYKLAWIKRYVPQVWERASHFLCFEDLMKQRLGLEPSMGFSLAGRTMLFDVRNECWSKPILAALGLNPDQLATPLAPGSYCGTIPNVVADELGLPHGVAVVAGGHDQTMAALGAGVGDDGSAMYAMGTVECICPVFGELRQDQQLQRANLCSYHSSIPGMYSTVAYNLTGGNLLKWYKQEIGRADAELALERGQDPYSFILSQLPEEPSSLLALPYFAPSGTPYFHPEPCGAVLGFSLNTGRHELLRGLLEGVAFEMRLNLAIMEQVRLHVTELVATGGGARSDAMCQLKADVLGLPMRRSDQEEAGCFGAAKLGMAYIRNCNPRDITFGQGGACFYPNPIDGRYYEERFEQYQLLYPAMKNL